MWFTARYYVIRRQLAYVLQIFSPYAEMFHLQQILLYMVVYKQSQINFSMNDSLLHSKYNRTCKNAQCTVSGTSPVYNFSFLRNKSI